MTKQSSRERDIRARSRVLRTARAWYRRYGPSSAAYQSVDLHGVLLGLDGISVGMQEALAGGRYEEAEVQMCRELLVTSDAVVEIGSAIGFLGIFATKVLGVASYRSIEANPNTAQLLVANYERNGLKPDLVIAALAPRDGPVALSVTTDFWTNTTCSIASGVVDTLTVPGCTLTTLLNSVDYDPTALIIDVEGAETCLLTTTIPETVCKVIIELHPAMIGVTVAFDILKCLMDQKFRVQSTLDTTYALVR